MHRITEPQLLHAIASQTLRFTGTQKLLANHLFDMSFSYQPFIPNFIKRPLPVVVTFSTSVGTLATLEGLVLYEKGDALVTGAVGEKWPIRRATFETTYEPCEGQLMGEDGQYFKKAIKVRAEQLIESVTLKLDDQRGDLTGRPKDWIVTDASGRQWIVADVVFRRTYDALDASKASKN